MCSVPPIYVCIILYLQHTEFLLELDDPIHVYEEKAKTSSGEEGNSYERGMNELANMNRTQQIELISGYNDMKDSLAEYLKNFAEQKKVSCYCYLMWILLRYVAKSWSLWNSWAKYTLPL